MRIAGIAGSRQKRRTIRDAGQTLAWACGELQAVLAALVVEVVSLQ